jgi:hypothetical protein
MLNEEGKKEVPGHSRKMLPCGSIFLQFLVTETSYENILFLLVALRRRISGGRSPCLLAIHPWAAGIRPELVDDQRFFRSFARGKDKTVNRMRHAVAPIFSERLVLASCLLAPTMSGPAVTHPLEGAMRPILITALKIRVFVQKNNSNPLRLVSLVGIFYWCFPRNPPYATSSPLVAVPIASTQRKPSTYLLFGTAGAADIDECSNWRVGTQLEGMKSQPTRSTAGSQRSVFTNQRFEWQIDRTSIHGLIRCERAPAYSYCVD